MLNILYGLSKYTLNTNPIAITSGNWQSPICRSLSHEHLIYRELPIATFDCRRVFTNKLSISWCCSITTYRIALPSQRFRPPTVNTRPGETWWKPRGWAVPKPALWTCSPVKRLLVCVTHEVVLCIYHKASNLPMCFQHNLSIPNWGTTYCPWYSTNIPDSPPAPSGKPT